MAKDPAAVAARRVTPNKGEESQRRSRVSQTHSLQDRQRTAPQPKTPKGSAIAKVIGSIVDKTQSVLARPTTDFVFLLGLFLCVFAFGVMMNLSTAITATPDASLRPFIKQLIPTTIGVIGALVVLKLPLDFLRKCAWAVLGVTVALLIIVLTPLGVGGDTDGSQSWIPIGPLTFQPSELARFALVLWVAYFVGTDRYRKLSAELRIASIVAVGITLGGLIVAEKDLGMAFMFAALLLMMGWVIGVSKAVFGFFGVVFLGLLGVVMMGGGYRAQRFTNFFKLFMGNFEDKSGHAAQNYQGFVALAQGGMGGLGLGQSRAKWFYLPENSNDFVFAIVGEELGMFGALVLILVYLGIAIFGFRVSKRHTDPFASVLAAGITFAICFQALYNIGYVVGAFPMTGVQLPLVSSGGSSIIVFLTMSAVLLSLARHEPEAVAFYQSNPVYSLRKHLLPVPQVVGAAHNTDQAAKKLSSRGRTEAKQPPAQPAGLAAMNSRPQTANNYQPRVPRRGAADTGRDTVTRSVPQEGRPIRRSQPRVDPGRPVSRSRGQVPRRRPGNSPRG